MFWRRKTEQRGERDSDAQARPPAELPPRGELVPIRIVTENAVVDGWTHVGSERLSDLLNAEDMLSVSVEERPSPQTRPVSAEPNTSTPREPVIEYIVRCSSVDSSSTLLSPKR